ncbi:MAG: MerR family transcriptional regulator, partial [Actinomycetota bacterium]|nr:MerR family transcriptional regulator [Actinomycetota bacterium]
MASSAASRARMSIGEALAQLKSEFPDENIKESKIRFLESEGLVEPERTPSGYRKYSDQDMQRLRYILRAQKEQYLPLKVIKDHLDAIDRGLEVNPAPGFGPTVPRVVLAGDGLPASESYGSDRGDLRISRRELLKTAEITEQQLEQLEAYGLVRTRTGSAHFDGESLLIARTAG